MWISQRRERVAIFPPDYLKLNPCTGLNQFRPVSPLASRLVSTVVRVVLGSMKRRLESNLRNPRLKFGSARATLLTLDATASLPSTLQKYPSAPGVTDFRSGRLPPGDPHGTSREWTQIKDEKTTAMVTAVTSALLKGTPTSCSCSWIMDILEAASTLASGAGKKHVSRYLQHSD